MKKFIVNFVSSTVKRENITIGKIESIKADIIAAVYPILYLNTIRRKLIIGGK